MKTVIKVENLSKKFRISRLLHNEGTLRDLIGNIIKHPFNLQEEEKEENLWALRNINFEVKQGEAFGIIGSNGAGKSTLLKILSRIIKPTVGYAKLYGRVGSLLEIGTGFHPDLTGRENIFLNGAVLGMRRREVERNFDEIVAFADLEKFLDTPVKFYSTGMYARLAFAVAAHLEPEILIVDEVLAVGDAAFQAKCLGKMGKVTEGGRTVLFVSHDAFAVTKLCKTGIYLEKGKIKKIGTVEEIMAQYKADYEPVIAAEAEVIAETSKLVEVAKQKEKGFIEWNIHGSESKISHTVLSREEVILEFIFVLESPVDNINFRLIIKDSLERDILSGTNVIEIKKGKHKIQWTCELPLKADFYKVFVEAYSLTEGVILDMWKCEPELKVLLDKTLPFRQIESLINIVPSFAVRDNE